MKINLRSIFKALQTPGSGLQTGALVGLAGLIYIIRAHPYIRLPQLYAEDGVLWLADGYNKGLHSIFKPDNGFLHTAERLFGLLVAHLPLRWAPAIFALTAWLLFVGMVYYLLSKRTRILSHNYERLFMALSLGLIANFREFFFNFSNSIFLLGTIGMLIMIADKPRNRVLGYAEKALFAVACFTLPFAWFYLPVALFERFKYKSKELFFLVLAAAGSIAQVLVYLSSNVNRSPVTFFSLISKYAALEIYNQIIIPAVRFARIDITLADYADGNPLRAYMVATVCLSVAVLALAVFLVAKKANKQLAYLLFFLGAMTFASIKSPTINVPTAQEALQNMAVVVDGNRYFVYGILATNIVMAKITYQYIVPRARYVFLAIFILFGLITSLRYQAFYINKNFTDYTAQYSSDIKQFESGKINIVTIPVNPTKWYVVLVRH